MCELRDCLTDRPTARKPVQCAYAGEPVMLILVLESLVLVLVLVLVGLVLVLAGPVLDKSYSLI